MSKKRPLWRREKRQQGSAPAVQLVGMRPDEEALKMPLALFKVERATSRPQPGMTFKIDQPHLKLEGMVQFCWNSQQAGKHYVAVEVLDASTEQVQ